MALLLALPLLAMLWLWLAPRSAAMDPPPPTRQPDRAEIPDVALSTLKVPIEYELAPVVRALEGAIPISYGSLGERIPIPNNDRVEVAYHVERQSMRATLIGDRARLNSVLSYRARAWYDPPVLPEIRSTCGTVEEPLRAVVTLSARLTLSPSWRLRGQGRVDHIGPLTEEARDRCELTAFRIDVTERVMTSAQEALVANLPKLEAELGRIDLRPRFERWWQILSEPIQLSDDVWLVIDPVGVQRGSTVGKGETLVAEVGLSARPRIVYGQRPEPPNRPLPQLGDGPVEEGLNIRASGAADYATASLRLTEELQGRELEHQGQTLILERVQVSGIGSGRLALDVYFSGSATGHMYLVGTPEFDQTSGEIYVPDLSFDVETQSLLLQGLAWLGEEEILEFFRVRARWRIDDLARLASEQLASGLNRSLTPDVRLEGTVDTVRIVGVYPLLDSLVVQAEARASASLIIAEMSPVG
ncbi:MAG: DUF4403 family protein [Longimicrobiales bacterium]